MDDGSKSVCIYIEPRNNHITFLCPIKNVDYVSIQDDNTLLDIYENLMKIQKNVMELRIMHTIT